MTSPRPARVQPKRARTAEKHDDVDLAGAGFSLAQRQAGRDCARNRPMRIFPIADLDYDHSVVTRHDLRDNQVAEVQFGFRHAVALGVVAQSLVTRGVV
jgi:hypothetical protein